MPDDASILRKSAAGVLLLALFVLAYWAPIVLDASVIEPGETRVVQLLDELLAQQPVRHELGRNLLALLGLQCLLCLLCCWAGLRLARRWRLSPFLSCLAILFVAWLALVSGNAWLFPKSNYSVALRVLASPGWVLASLALLLAVLCSAGRSVGYALASVALLLVIGAGVSGLAEGEVRGKGRTILLIGVDSLSADAFEKNQQLLPNLATLMAHSERYSRAYTPLGRTFPAWVSILSGQAPAEHGALFNLRNMDHVQRQGLLPMALKQQGYHTVFAIDERRFANIDESFGFDRVVGPKVGALDFVLQGVNDNPLSNLLLQTPVAAHFFPYSYINVAAHSSYSASGFVDRVLESTRVDKPLFLAVHFESGHFPYKTRHATVKVHHENPFMARYLEAMTVVDRQIGQLLIGLKAQGRLDDALVVFLSDHGEAVGEVEARLLRDEQPMEVRGYGHGVDLLSDRQNRVLLGALRFVHGEPLVAPAEHKRQVSLLGIRAIAEDFLRSGELKAFPDEPCLIVETGIRLVATADYRSLKESDVAVQAADFYEADAQGRLRLREERLPELLAGKDIGWRCAERLTWYDTARQRYLAYSLDEHGVPVKQVEPGADAMARISDYRDRYLHR